LPGEGLPGRGIFWTNCGNPTEQESPEIDQHNLSAKRLLLKRAGGNRNRDIADLLRISEETVKVHVKHIMDKLGANDRTQAIAIAVRRGIIQL
jgi:DNA-binding NarL/FixJ family response regulator